MNLKPAESVLAYSWYPINSVELMNGKGIPTETREIEEETRDPSSSHSMENIRFEVYD